MALWITCTLTISAILLNFSQIGQELLQSFSKHSIYGLLCLASSDNFCHVVLDILSTHVFVASIWQCIDTKSTKVMIKIKIVIKQEKKRGYNIFTCNVVVFWSQIFSNMWGEKCLQLGLQCIAKSYY